MATAVAHGFVPASYSASSSSGDGTTSATVARFAHKTAPRPHEVVFAVAAASPVSDSGAGGEACSSSASPTHGASAKQQCHELLSQLPKRQQLAAVALLRRRPGFGSSQIGGEQSSSGSAEDESLLRRTASAPSALVKRVDVSSELDLIPVPASLPHVLEQTLPPGSGKRSPRAASTKAAATDVVAMDMSHAPAPQRRTASPLHVSPPPERISGLTISTSSSGSDSESGVGAVTTLSRPSPTLRKRKSRRSPNGGEKRRKTSHPAPAPLVAAVLPAALSISGADPFRPWRPVPATLLAAPLRAPLAVLRQLARADVVALFHSSPPSSRAVQIGLVLHLRDVVLPSLGAALGRLPVPSRLAAVQHLLDTVPLPVHWPTPVSLPHVAAILVWGTAIETLAGDVTFVMDTALPAILVPLRAALPSGMPILQHPLSGLAAAAFAASPAPLDAVTGPHSGPLLSSLELLGWIQPLLPKLVHPWRLLVPHIANRLDSLGPRALDEMLAWVEALVAPVGKWDPPPSDFLTSVWEAFRAAPSSAWLTLGPPTLSVCVAGSGLSIAGEAREAPIGRLLHLMACALSSPFAADTHPRHELSEWDAKRLASTIIVGLDANLELATGLDQAMAAAQLSLAVVLASAVPCETVNSILSRVSALISPASASNSAHGLALSALVVFGRVLQSRGMRLEPVMPAIADRLEAVIGAGAPVPIVTGYLQAAASLIDTAARRDPVTLLGEHLLMSPHIVGLLAPSAPADLWVPAITFLIHMVSLVPPPLPRPPASHDVGRDGGGSEVEAGSQCPADNESQDLFPESQMSSASASASLSFDMGDFDDVDALVNAHVAEQESASTATALLDQAEVTLLRISARDLLMAVYAELCAKSTVAHVHSVQSFLVATAALRAVTRLMGVLSEAVSRDGRSAVSAVVSSLGTQSPWLVRDGDALARLVPVGFWTAFLHHGARTPASLVSPIATELIHALLLAAVDPFAVDLPRLFHTLASLPSTAALMGGRAKAAELWAKFSFAGAGELEHADEDAVVAIDPATVVLPWQAEPAAWTLPRLQLVKAVVSSVVAGASSPGECLAMVPDVCARALSELCSRGTTPGPVARAYEGFALEVMAMLAEQAPLALADGELWHKTPLYVLLHRFVIVGSGLEISSGRGKLMAAVMGGIGKLIGAGAAHASRALHEWTARQFDVLPSERAAAQADSYLLPAVAAASARGGSELDTFNNALVDFVVGRHWSGRNVSTSRMRRLQLWMAEVIVANPRTAPGFVASCAARVVGPLLAGARHRPCASLYVRVLPATLAVVKAMIKTLSGPTLSVLTPVLAAAAEVVSRVLFDVGDKTLDQVLAVLHTTVTDEILGDMAALEAESLASLPQREGVDPAGGRGPVRPVMLLRSERGHAAAAAPSFLTRATSLVAEALGVIVAWRKVSSRYRPCKQWLSVAVKTADALFAPSSRPGAHPVLAAARLEWQAVRAALSMDAMEIAVATAQPLVPLSLEAVNGAEVGSGGSEETMAALQTTTILAALAQRTAAASAVRLVGARGMSMAALAEESKGAMAVAAALDEVRAQVARAHLPVASGDGCGGWCLVHGDGVSAGGVKEQPLFHLLAEGYGWDCREASMFAAVMVLSMTSAVEELGFRAPAFYGDHSGGYVLQAEAAMRLAGASPRALATFLDPGRAHMKDGLIQVDASRLPSSTLWVSSEFLLALHGVTLGTDASLKLASTKLGELTGHDALTRNPGRAMGGVSSGADDDETALLAELDGLSDDGFDPDALVAQALADAGVTMSSPGARGAGGEGDDGGLAAYTTDLEYLVDEFEVVYLRMQACDNARQVRSADDVNEMRMFQRGATSSLAARTRELETKLQVAEQKIQVRAAAAEAAGFVPRLEVLARSSGLSAFEKFVLVACAAFHTYEPIRERSASIRSSRMMLMGGAFQVSTLLSLYCSTLEEQVGQRSAFLKNAPLRADGYINVVSTRGASDLVDCEVSIDRRVLDHIIGLATPLSEVVEGTHLYTPKVTFDDVVLPVKTRKALMDTLGSYEQLCALKASLGLEELVTYGSGMVLLFHGQSGTGKTLTANCVAAHLKRKVLLVNFASLAETTASVGSASDAVKQVFAEAKMHDAIVLFDECESLFMTRARGKNANLPALLTLMESFEGVSILATNMVNELDEATFRRVQLSISFSLPDHVLRAAIWRRHVPEGMTLANDVDVDALALKFELPGGFIKNAIVGALSNALARARAEGGSDGNGELVLTAADFEAGAQAQLESMLRQNAFERRVLPKAGLDSLVLPEATSAVMGEIVAAQKAGRILTTQWGFEAATATVALFHGPPGTGKTMAAAAIGYETGRALRVVNCAELVSKYVGETAKNIEKVFSDAASASTILVFDEAEGLFAARTAGASATDRYANVDTGLLLYHLEKFDGMAILTSNNIEALDPAFLRRIRYVVKFELPSASLRAQLWRSSLPETAPLAADVDFAALGAKYELAGGDIRNAAWRAACTAAGSGAGAISMAHLDDAGERVSAVGESSVPEYMYM
ncbi:uncharacterized protein AMSG_12258 [Thecamonas trahens ATCC 50062]|uniref:AAA+ ATPase domain-containing protein n=1 Tax=Thecamonas trahens ATCC 50062 TaxID=461836 RepID=A0A0L0DLH7_THETB|nr:hypothetical protein AMSG_12258 [Thecamonas trahens ATCC 50062]KNC53090.1 hypothetical protein AMSG_12258 [Thecamonas trahens ATCC 50062]|eukprot:XP_013754806.1 hypothetical protein AMSG_12258 [Thecamonas trahens ATCC 50062]